MSDARESTACIASGRLLADGDGVLGELGVWEAARVVEEALDRVGGSWWGLGLWSLLAVVSHVNMVPRGGGRGGGSVGMEGVWALVTPGKEAEDEEVRGEEVRGEEEEGGGKEEEEEEEKEEAPAPPPPP